MGNTGVIFSKRASDKLLGHIREMAKEEKWSPALDPMYLPDAFPYEVGVHYSNYKWDLLCKKVGSESEVVMILHDLLNEAQNPDYYFRRSEEFGSENYLLYRLLRFGEGDIHSVVIAKVKITGKSRKAEIIIL